MEITKLRFMPQDVDLFDALQIITTTPMRLLERRYDVYFKANNTTHHCYGLVYCILSNHPLQALISRVWGLCQYCHNLSAFLHEVEWLIKVGGQMVHQPQ